MSLPLIVGIGHPDRGDDAAGRVLAETLGRRAPGLPVAQCDGEATRLIALFEGRDAVVLVDACRSGAAPGTILRRDLGRDLKGGPLPRGLAPASSHGFGLAEAVELARMLDRLPPDCRLIGIEAARFDLGAPLTPAVAQAVARVAEALIAEYAEVPERLPTG